MVSRVLPERWRPSSLSIRSKLSQCGAYKEEGDQNILDSAGTRVQTFLDTFVKNFLHLSTINLTVYYSNGQI